MQMGVSLPWGKGERLDAEVTRVQGVLKVFSTQTDRRTHALTEYCLFCQDFDTLFFYLAGFFSIQIWLGG